MVEQEEMEVEVRNSEEKKKSFRERAASKASSMPMHQWASGASQRVGGAVAEARERPGEYRGVTRSARKVVKTVRWHRLPDVGTFRKGAGSRDIQGAMRKQKRSLLG